MAGDSAMVRFNGWMNAERVWGRPLFGDAESYHVELAKVSALIWSSFLMFHVEKEVKKGSEMWSYGWQVTETPTEAKALRPGSLQYPWTAGEGIQGALDSSPSLPIQCEILFPRVLYHRPVLHPLTSPDSQFLL